MKERYNYATLNTNCALDVIEDDLYLDHSMNPEKRDNWREEIQSYGYTYFRNNDGAQFKVTMRIRGTRGLSFIIDEI